RFPDIQISIDGGIDSSTVSSAAAYGANRFVAGTFLFKAPDMKTAICQLREKAEASYGSNIA
ncbi:MAG: ribulose-phosphate 3-epimerase, partial [Kiritimatiellaceae bacterium]|nr:ribulose-phosphate 3-epimerase [Kiritimatiellaceae bacterium]